jgi:hypothetical protein
MKRLRAESKLSSTLTGIAGEYLVAGELSRRGYVVSLTLRNTKGVDLLVSNVNATRSVGIQVKTNQTGKADWILSKKAEADLASNLAYVFVAMRGLTPPEFYVVPRADVARYVRESHQEWLAAPGRAGRAHRDIDMRHFKDPDAKYRDRWDLLDLDSPAADQP